MKLEDCAMEREDIPHWAYVSFVVFSIFFSFFYRFGGELLHVVLRYILTTV